MSIKNAFEAFMINDFKKAVDISTEAFLSGVLFKDESQICSVRFCDDGSYQVLAPSKGQTIIMAPSSSRIKEQVIFRVPFQTKNECKKGDYQDVTELFCEVFEEYFKEENVWFFHGRKGFEKAVKPRTIEKQITTQSYDQ